jgi:hypothetical protein
VQGQAWRYFQPYAAARTDGPFVDKFSYSAKLYDKTALQPTEGRLLGYVLNRMNLVGAEGEEGLSILARAGYDASRDEDKRVLLQAAGDWLQKDARRPNRIDFLVRHIDSTSHGGGDIGLVTEFPFHVTQAEWRWRQIRTLIHELGHVLMHPDLKNAAKAIAAPQVITEGFVEVITRELYNNIVGSLTAEIRDSIQNGVDKPADPEPTGLEYGKSGVAAARVFDQVGRDQFFRAFFNGDIRQVGLPPG